MQHPSDTSMTKEVFLEGLGLLSPEQLRSKSAVKRVERRRRTTANPKYNTNGFVELRQLTKRRRIEEAETSVKPSPPKRMTLISVVKPKENSLPKCYVCEYTDTELTCECCSTQYHAECIRVTGSKAPTPTRLPSCPNCISERLESFKLSMESSSSASSSAKFQSTNSFSSTIIPLGIEKNSLSRVNQNVVDYNSKACTKSKTGKKSSSSTPMTKKGGVNSTESAATLESLAMCKPILTSPFKSLTSLTSKGTAAAKNLHGRLGGNGVSNGETVLNGISGGSKSIKKKSKLNGIKAKTLSVTGKSTQNNGSPKSGKLKASPLINLNSNGNIPNVKTPYNGRLQSFAALTADQPLLMQRTILAMTAAAKSVMSSNGIRVVSPVSAGDFKASGGGSTSISTDKEQTLLEKNPPPPILLPATSVDSV